MEPKIQKKIQAKDTDKKQTKDNQKNKVHKGVFIADERRKGKGGRIKSQSIPNKIEVLMSKDIGYLHQTQVEWVEVRRYNKNQGRRKRAQPKKQNKKNLKFKAKQDEFASIKAQLNVEKKKYMLKVQKQENKKSYIHQNDSQIQVSQQKNEKHQQESKQEISQNKSLEEDIKQISSQKDTNIHEQKSKDNERVHSDHDEHSSSSEDEKKYLEAQQLQKKQQKYKQKQLQSERKQQRGEQEQNEQNDIVIVAKIKKQISNPFWKKPFVGIIKFIEPKNNKKQKFKEKDNQKSQISKIMDDFYIDLHPIHPRLPICAIQKNKNSQKLLEQYVQKNMTIDNSLKGGKIRNQILDELQCLYAQVKFIQWDRELAYVDIIKIIGKARTIDGQCNCFLYQHQLNDFGHEKQQQTSLNEADELNAHLSPIHKQYTQMVFTIDPLTSTDLDDALSVTQINQNQYEFGIHISDVSSYLDKIPRSQISRRTTSVYLPHSVFHMLPTYLVKISSLNPNVKRLAFSVFARLNSNGQVLSSRLEKNLLMSRFKLSYQQAQSIIVNQMTYQQFNKLHQCSENEYKTLVQKIKTLEKVGMAHRKKRLIFEIFDNDEVRFQLDEQKWPINYSVKRRFTAQKIVEQFMIIGNIESAKKSTQYDPQNSLIIHHPRPSDLGIRQFNQYFEMLNHKFKFETSLSLQQDLLKVQKMQNISQDIKRLCYFKARRVQQTATYKRFSQVKDLPGNIHFALGLRHYTHFTSPMRRFADILVHQLLDSFIDPTIKKKQLLDIEIQQANWGRKNTKKLKRDLTQMYLCLMIYRTNRPIQTQGIVSSFGVKSISIFLPLFDMNKQIMWRDLEVDKVFKNKQDAKKVDAVIYFDKKDPKKDIIWVVQKLTKIPIKLGCSVDIPLRLTLQFQVKTNSGKRVIKPNENKQEN